jgi:hypothetical protein
MRRLIILVAIVGLIAAGTAASASANQFGANGSGGLTIPDRFFLIDS